ncbi:MAG TPA: glucose-6-phosphate isomerase family protein [Symbiobacteriaceae bacterium]|nr:glucose-6-phosphate isomerase family protein [Symbiobacteriaceae bacterium]
MGETTLAANLPHQRNLAAATGVLGGTRLLERRLSDMPRYYLDQNSVLARLAENPLIYQVYDAPIPEEPGHLCHCTTVIKPGRIGDEFFMTKGHHHRVDAAEVYYFLQGEGFLVMESRDGTARSLAVSSGSVAYIPPGWAHRTVNTGAGDLGFYAVWPGVAGHDYASIEAEGFGLRVLATTEGPRALPAREGRS